jgi:ribosomal protein L14E/L6E/L27E
MTQTVSKGLEAGSLFVIVGIIDGVNVDEML